MDVLDFCVMSKNEATNKGKLDIREKGISEKKVNKGIFPPAFDKLYRLRAEDTINREDKRDNSEVREVMKFFVVPHLRVKNMVHSFCCLCH